MAHRDRSANHAFMYVDIRQLLQSNSEIEKDAQSGAPVVTDNNAVQVPVSTSPSPAISQLQQNLDRLQSLHHKLHAMLDELNKITGKK